MRETGYYWVKFIYSGWTPMLWNEIKNEWVCNRSDISEYAEQIPTLILEINETRIKAPDEQARNIEIKEDAKIFVSGLCEFVKDLKKFNPNGYPKTPDEK